MNVYLDSDDKGGRDNKNKISLSFAHFLVTSLKKFISPSPALLDEVLIKVFNLQEEIFGRTLLDSDSFFLTVIFDYLEDHLNMEEWR